jgi:hypothetical protein
MIAREESVDAELSPMEHHNRPHINTSKSTPQHITHQQSPVSHHSHQSQAQPPVINTVTSHQHNHQSATSHHGDWWLC